jgi:hypothetical protein
MIWLLCAEESASQQRVSKGNPVKIRNSPRYCNSPLGRSATERVAAKNVIEANRCFEKALRAEKSQETCHV